MIPTWGFLFVRVQKKEPQSLLTISTLGVRYKLACIGDFAQKLLCQRATWPYAYSELAVMVSNENIDLIGKIIPTKKLKEMGLCKVFLLELLMRSLGEQH